MIALPLPSHSTNRTPAIQPAIHPSAKHTPLESHATNPLGTRLLNLARAATAIHLAQTLRLDHNQPTTTSITQA